MHPILFQFGSFALPSFGVMLALGFLCGLTLAILRAPRQGIAADDALTWFPLLMLGGLIGGKLLYLAYFPEEFLAHPVATLLYPGGLVWYGGVAGAIVVIALWARRSGVSFLQLTDWLAPSLLLGLAFGRIGCYLAGCCFGAPCSLPWAVQYPVGHPTHPAFVHPAPLYESGLALLGMDILLIVGVLLKLPQPHRRGLMTGLLLIWIGVVRFGMEMLRGDVITPVNSVPLSASQWFSLMAVVAGLGFIWRWKALGYHAQQYAQENTQQRNAKISTPSSTASQ